MKLRNIALLLGVAGVGLYFLSSKKKKSAEVKAEPFVNIVDSVDITPKVWKHFSEEMPQYNEELPVNKDEIEIPLFMNERLLRGWSQIDLAARADVSQYCISSIESAKVNPTKVTVNKICAALSIKDVKDFDKMVRIKKDKFDHLYRDVSKHSNPKKCIYYR